MDFSFKGTPGKALQTDKRTVSKKIGDDKWINCSFEALRPGDVFQLFDNGVKFINASGHSSFKCDSLPFEQFGVLAVECTPCHA